MFGKNTGYILTDRYNHKYFKNVVGTKFGDEVIMVESYGDAHIFKSKKEATELRSHLSNGSRLLLEKIKLIELL